MKAFTSILAVATMLLLTDAAADPSQLTDADADPSQSFVRLQSSSSSRPRPGGRINALNGLPPFAEGDSRYLDPLEAVRRTMRQRSDALVAANLRRTFEFAEAHNLTVSVPRGLLEEESVDWEKKSYSVARIKQKMAQKN